MEDVFAMGSCILDGAVLAAFPDGVLVYAADGRCLLANEAAGALLGVSREDLLSREYDRLDLWKSPAFAGCAWQSVPRGRASTWDGSVDVPGRQRNAGCISDGPG